MSILDRFKKPGKAGPQRDVGNQTGEPGCSVCGTTRSQVIARIEARGLRAVGFYFGICPTSRKGFCRHHMVRGDKHDFTDFDKCPDDGTRLKVFGPHDPMALEQEPMVDASKLIELLGDSDSGSAGSMIETFFKAPNHEQARRVALELAVSGDPRAADAFLISVRAHAGQGGGRQDFVYPCLEALALLLDRAAEQVPIESLAALAKLHEEKFYSPVLGEELTLPKLLSNKEQYLPSVVERAQRELDRRASP